MKSRKNGQLDSAPFVGRVTMMLRHFQEWMERRRFVPIVGQGRLFAASEWMARNSNRF